MNKQALFSDGTGSYVWPPDPSVNSRITIRFRTAKDDVENVWLVSGNERLPMTKRETEGNFDYYTVEKQLGKIGRAHV